MYDENSLRSRAAVWLLVGGVVMVYIIGPIATIVWLLWPAINKILSGGG